MPPPVPLPIDDHLPAVVSALRGRRSLVLVAEPGAGKTTRVPPAVLDADGLLSADHPQLVLLQPRRVAARAAAGRIAGERGGAVGGEVGYQVRGERKVSAATRLRVVTEGVLTRQLAADPFLAGVGGVILDEFHERSVDADLCLALLREARRAGRDDLLIVVMSATLEAGPVARYLADEWGDATTVSVPGRTFPVEVEYRPIAPGATIEQAVRAAVEAEISNPKSEIPDLRSQISDSGFPPTAPPATAPPGDVLAFLPGVGEIDRACRALAPLAEAHGLDVLPLHGAQPPAEQNRAIAPARAGRRKVVCATNVAETSLTIDGVTVVIDAGLARVASFDAGRGLDRLDLSPIPRSSADQRAGRAGRTRPGRCVRLWSAREHAARPAFGLPEVRRVDLAPAVLALAAWGAPDPAAFAWYDRPDDAALDAASDLLRLLGATDDAGRLTPLGARLDRLPVHPRLGRLLLAAHDAGLPDDGAAMAAVLAERDLVPPDHEARRAGPTAVGDSDLLARLDLLDEARRSRFAPHLRDRGVDPIAARRVAEARDELRRVVGRSSPAPGHADAPDRDDALARLPLLAYPDRVCRRRSGDPTRAGMVGGSGVRLSGESLVQSAEFFLALDARHDPRSPSREATVRVAHAIDPAWLGECFPDQVTTDVLAVYDGPRGRVIGVRRTRYRDLVIAEHPGAAVTPDAASAALARHLAPDAASAAAWVAADGATAGLLRRLSMLDIHLPIHLRGDGGGEPGNNADGGSGPFAPDPLALVAEACRGASTPDAARRNLRPAVENRLGWPDRRRLDEHAPESIAVPTGNRVTLDWLAADPSSDPPRGPVLAVRLQELFGLPATPRVCGGAVPVVLHLLGPNHRPVQVTDDLSSFWANTYPQVRRDLRARYPKHSWPDDPTTADPTARGGRRR